MKILIVDDANQKVAKLIELLVELRVSRDHVDVVQTAMAAREKLRANSYDLLILDLLLPLREETEPSLEVATALLIDITEADAYIKPARIVGFTAFQDSAQAASPLFSELLWSVITYDSTSNEWMGAFRNAVKYIQDVLNQNHVAEYDIDICIVTALASPEMEAVLKLPWGWEDSYPIDDATFVRQGRVQSGSKSFSVVAASAPRMGCVASALLSAKLIQKFRPRFLIMLGICAGIRGKVNLGDVVLFEPAWEWASGKLVSAGEGAHLEPSPHQIGVSEFIVGRAEEFAKKAALLSEIRGNWPSPPDTALRLVIGPGASGASVVANTTILGEIQTQHRKLTAVDMEVYGVYAAARSASVPRPSVLALKAVCDFADEKKSSDWQAYASYTSANIARLFLEAYLDGMVDLAGT